LLYGEKENIKKRIGSLQLILYISLSDICRCTSNEFQYKLPVKTFVHGIKPASCTTIEDEKESNEPEISSSFPLFID
jgi:hypothetical protein